MPDGARRRLPAPHRHGGLGRRARVLAHLWGLGAIALFASLAVTVGLPRSLEGGLLGAGLETRAQAALLGLAALGMLVAWVRPAVGGWIAAVASVGLGVLAGVQYRPHVALLVCLAFFVPAALEIAVGTRGRRLVASGLAALALLTVAGVGSVELHRATFGPTHPGSTTTQADSDLVDWVWSGGVTATGATVKARLAGDGEASLRVTSAAGRSLDVLPTSPGPWPGDVVAFSLTGLEPATEYRYVVEVGGVPDETRAGRFTTFPVGPASFTVAVGSCARVGSNGSVFDAIRALEPTLFLVSGDFFYANIDENDPDLFREQFQQALTRPAQAALYRTVPIAYVWDDHDYGPDNADMTAPSRDAARAVYREAVPHYDLPAGAEQGAIYQAFTIGRVRFVLTDTRSEREPLQATGGAPRSILGAEQKAWLKRELLAASGRFPVIVWVNAVPWIGAADPAGDGWSAFAEERAELADFIAGNGIDGLVMVSGDAHMVAIDDGSNSDYSSTRAGGFPVLHAAALDRRGSVKGGPYSEGAFPGSGQFGLVSVVDDGGDTVAVTLRGLNWRGEELVAYRFDLPAQPAAG